MNKYTSAFRVSLALGGLAPFVMGCGGFGPTGAPPTPFVHGIYVLMGGGTGVRGYTLDPASGKLTEITNSPFPTAPDAKDLFWDQDSMRLFVAGGSAHTVWVHERSFGGQLIGSATTQIPGATQDAFRIAEASGRVYVYEGDQSTGQGIHQFTVNPNHTLTPLATPKSSIGGLDPVALEDLDVVGNDVLAFKLGTAARLQARQPDAGGDLLTGHENGFALEGDSVEPDPNGQFAYVAYKNRVSCVSLANPMTLSVIAPNGLTLNDFTTLAVDPLGRAVYVGGDASDGISSIPIVGPGALGLPQATLAVGGSVQAMAVDSQGKWLYVASANGHFIKVYHLQPDGSIGALADIVNLGAGNPKSIAVMSP